MEEWKPVDEEIPGFTLDHGRGFSTRPSVTYTSRFLSILSTLLDAVAGLDLNPRRSQTPKQRHPLPVILLPSLMLDHKSAQVIVG